MMEIIKNLWHKFIHFWIKFFKVVWAVVKSMNTLRGYIALFLAYVIYHGWALAFVVIGTVVGNGWMIGIGSAVLLFWFGPGTPVIPLIIVTALFIQRYLLFDKSHSVNIMDKWKELTEAEKEQEEINQNEI